MKKLLLLCGLCGIIGCSKVNAQTELKVLQWNIWQEGTMVPGGYEAIVSEIARLEPDFVTFSESGITTKPVFATVSSPLYEKREKPTTRSTATTPVCSANIPSLILPPSSLKRMTTAAFIVW